MVERNSVHAIDLPKKIVVGDGVIANLKDYVKELGLGNRKTLILTGPIVRKLVEDRVLRDFDISHEVLEVMKADVATVDKVADFASKINVGSIIGIGGGTVIDVAKFSAYRLGVPFISVPTAPSHDGITSPFASIKGLGKPTSVKAKEPLAIIADLEVLSSAPRRLINAGIGDAIGKIVAVRDWQLAAKLRGEYYGDYTASLALLSAKHAMSCAYTINKDLKKSVRTLIEALISDGVAMAMAGTTRPASGSEHLFAHAVEMLSPDVALHGELVALGTIMMAYLHGLKWKRIKAALKKAGIPTKAKELGIPSEVVIKALTIAHSIRPERYTILGERGLTWESAENLAKITGVID
ncbi:MAG: NAD(P)-dependent glycerol-1-phosphate dehydrogenase [Thermoprotei archaeon]